MEATIQSPPPEVEERLVNTNGLTSTGFVNGGGYTSPGPNGGFVGPAYPNPKGRKPIGGFVDEFTTMPVKNGHTHGHRHISRTIRRSSSYRSSYRYDQVVELEEKAESQLFSLMEFIASGARQASLLKECWSQLVAQRGAFEIEREEWCQQIEELTEQLECLEGSGDRFSIEIGEKDKRIEKLLLDLSIAVASLAAEKRKVTERDNDIIRLRREIHDWSEKYSHKESEYSRVQTELEKAYQKIRIVESERDTARSDADRYQKDYHRVSRERTELKTRLVEITDKYESVRRELSSFKEKVRELEREREQLESSLTRLKEEYSQVIIERDEYKESSDEWNKKYEECRRNLTRTEELLIETENKLSTARSEVESLKERVSHLEIERDDAVHDRDHLKTEIGELQATILLLEAQIRTITESRDGLRIEIGKIRHYYENEYVCNHEHHEHHDKHLELSVEVEKLKKVLLQVRTEKENAVKQRIAADTERDSATLRYEQVCRERRNEQEWKNKPFPGRGYTTGRPVNGGNYRIMSDSTEDNEADTSIVESVVNHGENRAPEKGNFANIIEEEIFEQEHQQPIAA